MEMWERFSGGRGSIGVLTAAYRDFGERVGGAGDTEGPKSQAVRKAVEAAGQPFTMQDLINACPTTSQATIRKVLNHMMVEGLVECIEKGRNAKWIRKS